MKKLATLIAIAAGSLVVKNADAQIGLHVNLHLGGLAAHVVLAQPVVAPEYPVYDNSDDYYYLPDVEAYYSVPDNCYFYMDNGRWISAQYLPGQYHDYNWKSFRHYEVRERRPYMHHDQFKNKFGGMQPQERSYGYDNHQQRGFDQHDQQRGNWGGDQRNNDQREHSNYFRDQRDNQMRDAYRSQQQPQYQNSQPSYPQSGHSRGNDQQRGQYQNNNSQPQGRNDQYQNSNNGQQRGQGGQTQNGNGWQRGSDQQRNNSGQQNSQPSNDRGNHFTGNFPDRNSNNANRVAQNRTSDMRPARF